VLTEDFQRADVQVSVALSGGPAKVQVVIRDGDQIVAEAEGEAIVFGMPREAIATNLVDKVVPLDAVADEILRAAGNASP